MIILTMSLTDSIVLLVACCGAYNAIMLLLLCYHYHVIIIVNKIMNIKYRLDTIKKIDAREESVGCHSFRILCHIYRRKIIGVYIHPRTCLLLGDIYLW